MMQVNVHDYAREVSRCYDSEHYNVRDNGAVLRQPRKGKRLRKYDNVWTFGTPCSQSGYMHIAQVRVHRIVATAFHGAPPAPEYVVDHIDTNRRNNRPENLRWLTRLENALLNPITLKRIEFICGSIEAFLEEPSRLGQSVLEPNFEWMRAVTEEEAQASLGRMRAWASSTQPSSGHGSLGEWLFRPKPVKPIPKRIYTPIPTVAPARFRPATVPAKEWLIPPDPAELVPAITPGAAQRNWRTPSEFPACPQGEQSHPILAYAADLKPGVTFSRNTYSAHTVIQTATSDDNLALLVLCQSDGMKPWSFATVTYEDGLYVHENCGSNFTKEGAEKQFCLAQGLEWAGGDSIDDYC